MLGGKAIRPASFILEESVLVQTVYWHRQPASGMRDET
ncbi:Hypothetical protein SCC1_0551 [Pectobacterium versatile]|uniref:Uncharacterized protein n=1 Tax=Pectobacterium versatile TaxID=2488639 RepID=A0A855MFH1_9GAMM|nr:Hypothetical protein SCC1_0551 [Pectobacterium versatile]POY51100.1 hypothetical protein F131LOC_01167 [Pectobacterium versatile]RUR88814.1 hypothetical protein PB16LOC_04074 [Pectobacterium versatile]